MQNTCRVDALPSTFAFDCEVANHIVYYQQSKGKTRPETIIYQLINYFGRVELRTAQVACNFVYLFRKNLISFAELRKPF